MSRRDSIREAHTALQEPEIVKRAESHPSLGEMMRESLQRYEAQKLTWTDTEYAVDLLSEKRQVAIQLGRRILKRAIRHLEDRCEAELFGRTVRP